MSNNKLENLAELYSSKLRNSTNPGQTLSRFLGLILDIETNRSHIIAMNKLLKIFGRWNVFQAILDSGNMKDKDNYYAYLYTVCKRKFEETNRGSLIQSYNSLTRTITEIDKEVERTKKRKLKVPDYSILKNKESDKNE